MRDFSRSVCAALTCAMVAFMLSACGGGSNGTTSPMPQTAPGSGSNASAMSVDSNVSVLQQLTSQRTIGSTVDPINGDQNPYGLDIAKVSAGKIIAGDLVVCNFNNNNAGGNIQGQGTTIVALHPTIGSTPTHIAVYSALRGCNALAAAPNGNIWNAAFVANLNPFVSSDGAKINTLTGGPWNHPFGEAIAPNATPFGKSAFYVSNAGDGSIVRVNVTPNTPFSFQVIATGFPVNHGAPGGILGPSGLQYNAANDQLVIVDGTNNAVYAINQISTIPAHGLSVNPSGTSFSGPFGSRARVVYIGAPLNGPISSAILFNGNLAIGNTTDPNGKNLIVEISPAGKLLFVRNVDTGTAGAIFGMVAAGSSLDTQRLYYNNDNDNTVRLLSK